MAGQPVPFRNPAGHAGLMENLLSLLGSLAGYFETRLQLFGRESKAALVHLVVILACLLAALGLLAFGYVFLVVSVIVGIAHLTGVSWVWIALLAALAHFALAAVCVVIALARVKEPMLRDSVTELKRDREWLKTLDKKNR